MSRYLILFSFLYLFFKIITKYSSFNFFIINVIINLLDFLINIIIYIIYKYIILFNSILYEIIFENFISYIDNRFLKDFFCLLSCYYFFIYYFTTFFFISILSILYLIFIELEFKKSFIILEKFSIVICILFFLGKLMLFTYINLVILPSLIIYFINYYSHGNFSIDNFIKNFIKIINRFIIKVINNGYKMYVDTYLTDIINLIESKYDFTWINKYKCLIYYMIYIIFIFIIYYNITISIINLIINIDKVYLWLIYIVNTVLSILTK